MKCVYSFDLAVIDVIELSAVTRQNTLWLS
jgi:hypothetical protein